MKISSTERLEDLPNIGRSIANDLRAAGHYLKTSEALPWWRFTEEGKRLLSENP